MAIRTCGAICGTLLLLVLALGAQSGFTDDPVIAGVTAVRAVHVTELRSRINAIRSARGLSPFVFTDATLVAGTTRIRAAHLLELRTAISQAYAAAGLPVPLFTDPTIGQGTIRAVHIAELRAAVAVLDGTGGPQDNEDPFLSAAVVTLANVAPDAFNDLAAATRFNIANGQFSSSPGHVQVFHGGHVLDSALVQVTPQAVVLAAGLLIDGPNDIELLARDSTGRYIEVGATLWAGSATLLGQVVDEQAQPIAGATVTLRLGVDPLVRATTTTSGTGAFSFSHVPQRTVTLEARTADNRLAFSSVKGDADPVILEAKAIGPPSAIDNNDFSLGTDGWDVGVAPVEIIPHTEGSPADGVGAADEPDFDLKLNTFGEGAQQISRTFTVKPGNRFVKVRYRFVTSEVPGGFFGTEFDDSFSVAVRSDAGHGVISESASMNSLGLGAFDGSGATRWRETSLPVGEFGDVVRVDLSVANVADELLDSYVVIDAVAENSFGLSDIELKDIDDSELERLSLSAHSYFSGRTRIRGELTIEGEGEDGSFTITLEIIQEGELRAIGQFVGLQPVGVRPEAGAKFEYTFKGPLFEIDSQQLAMIDKTEDSSVFLVVRARTAAGKQSIFPVGPVTLLTRYAGANRFGDRNAAVGGDDWAQPGLIDIATHFSNNVYGDFSNMNGGAFPPHAAHRTGDGVDGWFPGYNARNAATAATIISQLNDPLYGSRIARVLVTFDKVSSDPFWNAISNVILADGRRASNVIHPAGGYQTRFHWDRVTTEDADALSLDVAPRRARARAAAR